MRRGEAQRRREKLVKLGIGMIFHDREMFGRCLRRRCASAERVERIDNSLDRSRVKRPEAL